MSIADAPTPKDSRAGSPTPEYRHGRKRNRQFYPVIRRRLLISVVLTGLLLCGTGFWLFMRTIEVKAHLTSAASLVPEIKLKIAAGNVPAARSLLGQVQSHTHAARLGVGDPLWKIASGMPLYGQNFMAVSEMAHVADSVVAGAGAPLLDTLDLLASGALTPNDGVLELALFEQASPGIVAAAQTTEQAGARLEALDRTDLVGEISVPLEEVIRLLRDVQGPLNVAADLTEVLPEMLGSVDPRNYLVLIQNNAELRATGGLSGALAVVRVEHGKLELAAQTTATGLGKFVPPIAVDPEQEHIFSNKLGSQISGTNLTPDFPTAAQAAKAMWETRHGTVIDGVVALDPIVLSHILKASGPLALNTATGTLPPSDLPSTLSAENVAKTLLSDVYLTMDYVEQDKFFAAAARQVFEALAAGKAPAIPLIQAMARSTEENRLHVWSRLDAEQRFLTSTKLGGSISLGPNAGPGSFGVFFNDGTGSKMDYYVRHRVQLIKECTGDGNGQTVVRTTLTNTAPADARTSLPEGVTGGGNYGVPPGSVQTNVVIYGPPQANIETAEMDGIRTDFAPYLHRSRPVGVVTTRLAPGETRMVDMAFSKIGQGVELHVVVTPTVQDVKDVTSNPYLAACSN